MKKGIFTLSSIAADNLYLRESFWIIIFSKI